MKLDRRTKKARWWKKNRQVVLASVTLALITILLVLGTLKQTKDKPLLNPLVKSEWTAPISKQEYEETVIKHFGLGMKQPNITPTKAQGNTKHLIVREVKAAEKPSTVEALVRSYFPEEPEIMLAIFKHESGLNPKAQGWNCYYDGKSKACKKEDRVKAWSTDCGIVQNNFPGTVCPDYSFDPEWSVKEGRKKYDANEKMGIDGKLRWSSYKNGSYRRYL
jgi:hypothetical protein